MRWVGAARVHTHVSRSRRRASSLVRHAARWLESHKDTGTPGHRSRLLSAGHPAPRVRRFLFSRVPHFTGGAEPDCGPLRYRNPLRYPRGSAVQLSRSSVSKHADRSYCRTGGPLGAVASSTQAGFAAYGCRQDAVCKSLPRRGSVTSTPRAPLPARTAGNRTGDALGGRERERYVHIFLTMSRGP